MDILTCSRPYHAGGIKATATLLFIATIIPLSLFSEEISITLPGQLPLIMVRVPAGSFMMGAPNDEFYSEPDEWPQHQVTISKDFFISKYEVTQAQWQSIMGYNPAHGHGEGPNYPVYNVSWQSIANPEATQDRPSFLLLLNQYLAQTGQPGAQEMRLPTEAEWEYSCRAGSQQRFFYGDVEECNQTDCFSCLEASPFMWWCGNDIPLGSKPVGQLQPNNFGLSDTHGNLYEWVNDWYGPYSAEPQIDPTGPSEPGDRWVFRGGSYESIIAACRSAMRGEGSGFRTDLGFRLASNDLVHIPGDCNANGTISIGEVQKAINMFLGLESVGCKVDCSNDHSVSIGEVQKVINIFLGLQSSC